MVKSSQGNCCAHGDLKPSFLAKWLMKGSQQNSNKSIKILKY